jgi:alpha-N-arabinofuranosidase
VKLACLAQLINVIAPIMTSPNGLFRQTIYYPYSWALQFARGSVLNLLVESPGYEVAGMGQVPYLDVAGTISAEDGKVSLFVLNRDLSKAHAIEVNWQDKAPARTLSSVLLTGDDLKAFNSFDAPQKVAPRTLDKPSIAGGRAKFEVPARSYAVIQWGS